MNFIFIFIVGIIAVQQLPNKSTQIAENKELKLIVANPISEKKIEQIVKLVSPKQEVVQKESKPVPPKQEVVQKESKPVPPKQEVINQETVKSISSIEKAVSYFSQYYLIGLVLAAVAYVYFRTRKKITLKEILNKEEFKSEPSAKPTTAEEFKSEPSVEPTITEEVKSDSQSPESSDEEEKK